MLSVIVITLLINLLEVMACAGTCAKFSKIGIVKNEALKKERRGY